jgi:hypothetical protein
MERFIAYFVFRIHEPSWETKLLLVHQYKTQGLFFTFELFVLVEIHTKQFVLAALPPTQCGLAAPNRAACS